MFPKFEIELAGMLTEDQAAAVLQIDRRTLRKLIEHGRLDAIDVGSGKRRHFRIAPKSLTEIGSKPQENQSAPRVTRFKRQSRRQLSTNVLAYLPVA
jgi:excisionase family DNA binding protein